MITACAAAHESVLVVPASDRTAILVRGKDRRTWLNGLLTCELGKWTSGDAAYGLLVEKKGKIQSDVFVVEDAAGEVLALAVPTPLRDALVPTLDHYLIMEDAELRPADMFFAFAHGPRARELPPLAPFMGRVDLLGRGGLILGVPIEEKDALLTRLGEAAAHLGGLVCDDAAWEPVRIEHGLARFGVEVDTSLYPQEASLEKLAVSFSKGCYLGQEVVYMLQERGHVQRKLVVLDFVSGAAPSVGAEVTTPEGERVGEVKSAAVGPASGRPVAIAMVKWAVSKPGASLRVAGQDALVRAAGAVHETPKR